MVVVVVGSFDFHFPAFRVPCFVGWFCDEADVVEVSKLNVAGASADVRFELLSTVPDESIACAVADGRGFVQGSFDEQWADILPTAVLLVPERACLALVFADWEIDSFLAHLISSVSSLLLMLRTFWGTV